MIIHRTFSVTASSNGASATISLRELALSVDRAQLLANYDGDNLVVRGTTGRRTFRTDFFGVMFVDVVDRVEASINNRPLQRNFNLVRAVLETNMGV